MLDSAKYFGTIRKLQSFFSEVMRFARQNVQDKSEEENIPKS